MKDKIIWKCPNCNEEFDCIIIKGDGQCAIGISTLGPLEEPVLYCLDKELLELDLPMFLDLYGSWPHPDGGYWLGYFHCHKCGRHPDMRFKQNKLVDRLILESFDNRVYILELKL